jgi:hypothetical protein
MMPSKNTVPRNNALLGTDTTVAALAYNLWLSSAFEAIRRNKLCLPPSKW